MRSLLIFTLVAAFAFANSMSTERIRHGHHDSTTEMIPESTEQPTTVPDSTPGCNTQPDTTTEEEFTIHDHTHVEESTTDLPTEGTTERASTSGQHHETTDDPLHDEVINDDGHEIHVKCFKEGPISHPHNPHKYIVCHIIPTFDGRSTWKVYVMPCPIGTRWHNSIKNCIQDN